VETSLVRCEQEVLHRRVRGHAAHVLEAGCGRRNSRADSLAAPELGVRTVVGVDVDADAGKANRGLDRFVAADLCGRLPFAAGTFDLVYASFVVEHLEEPCAAFREWRRVLRPGGALLVVTPNMANPLMRMAALLPQRVRVALKRLGPGVEPQDVFRAPYRANTAAALRRIAGDSGFVVSDVRYVATLHRYAGNHRPLRGLLLASEALLPAERRSTLVVLFVRSRSVGGRPE
jgi:SAM-dependent methyltransferase